MVQKNGLNQEKVVQTKKVEVEQDKEVQAPKGATLFLRQHLLGHFGSGTVNDL
jgi:hypothetical protein